MQYVRILASSDDHSPATTAARLNTLTDVFNSCKSQLNEASSSTAMDDNLNQAKQDLEQCVQSHQAHVEKLRQKHRSETDDLHAKYSSQLGPLQAAMENLHKQAHQEMKALIDDQSKETLQQTSRFNFQWRNIRERIDKLNSGTEELAYQPQQMQDRNIRGVWHNGPISLGDGVSIVEDENLADVNGRTMEAVQARMKSREDGTAPRTRRQAFTAFIDRVKGLERDGRIGEHPKMDRSGVP